MLKSVEQSEKENATFEEEFRNQNSVTRQREDEAYEKLEEVEAKFSSMKNRDIALDKELEVELNRLN